ncbi:MAG: SDR family oxidoreductase, partial [Bacteroidota bacterium]
PAGLELLNSGRDALPDHLNLHYHYALLLATATEDAAAARKEVEALLDRSPDHPDALFLNGELYEAANNHTAARENWEQLSDVEPFYPDLNIRLGTLIADRFPEEVLDAAAYLRRASKDEPVNAEACYRYALLLASPALERHKKAIKQLRRAVEADPEHARAHYQLAVLLHERGKYGAARNAYLTAARLDPVYDTPANQATLTISPSPQPAEIMAATAAEEAALAALKQNIADLETMIADREAALKTDPAPSAAPKVGDGKTVLISGASSGIGRATARRLAADGYRLILLGRRLERLQALAEELETEVLLLQVDVRDRERVGELIADLPAEWAAIDVLLNNAGKAKGFDPIHAGDQDHWEEMIDVNLKGLLYLTRAVSPGMVSRRTGMIINVASTAGKEVYPNGNVYCATKHAVDALTYAMRLDLVQHGIRVGQICPAHVEETEFAVVRFDGDTERAKIYEDFQPLRSPDVAEAIAFMVNQPPHVNIMDVVLQGTQQASSTVVDRSGRDKFSVREEE